MAGDIARGIEIVRRTEDRPNEHVVLYRTRDQVLGRKLGRDETDAGRYLEKGAKIAVRNLFRQADLLDEDEIRINRMSHAERIDRDIRKHFRREDSGDREYERRRAKLDGNTTNLRRIGGGRVGVTESLHLNYEKDIYKGKLDIRPKVDVDEVGVYAAWRRTF